MSSKTILFVFHGNICRSPMAEGFLNMFLEKNDKPVEKVLSAGLNALGGPPTPEAIETMREEDIERQRHYGSFDLDHISSRSLEDKGRMG